MPRTARGDAGSKVLAAAHRLFYARGIHSVGVDTVAAESGVTKAALYGNFGSKDRLVIAYLRERDRRWQQQLDDVTATEPDPRARILAVFDGYDRWLREGGYRGCAFLNAAAEYPDPDSPVREVVRSHKESVRSYLQAQLERLGSPEPTEKAEQLMLLLEGAVARAMIRRDGEPLRTARALGAALLPQPAAGQERTQHQSVS